MGTGNPVLDPDRQWHTLTHSTTRFILWGTLTALHLSSKDMPNASRAGERAHGAGGTFSLVLPATGALYNDIFSPKHPDVSIRSCSEAVRAILTFSPLGPESPLRPGKPGGPFGRQGGKQKRE